MSEVKENLKELIRSIASTTKQKVSAYNLANEKEDLFTGIGSKVYEMWKQGETIPECLTEDLVKIVEIEETIKAMQEAQGSDASEETPVYSDTPAEAQAAPGFAQAAEYAAKDDGDVPVIEVEDEEGEPENCPLSSAINDLFEKIPPVDKMKEKVNNSLDELGANLRKFSGKFEKELNEFAERMSEKADTVTPDKKTEDPEENGPSETP